MRIKKFTIDLSTARTDVSLVGANLIPSKLFVNLTILNKGTGTFSFKFKYSDDSLSESFTQDEILSGDVINCVFKDIIWTNTSQTVTNPTLIVSWREV
jgi:hypothetical protein